MSLGSINSVHLCKDGSVLSDQKATDVLLQQFSENFSCATVTQQSLNYVEHHEQSLSHFNCTSRMVAKALQSCPNSHSSSENISFSLLKTIRGYIVTPLNIIFQHPLPLFKKKGSKTSSVNYRSISLCQRLEKLLERIVYSQLADYVRDNKLICSKQYGFVVSQSTLANPLECDANIAAIMTSKQVYDLIAFDFAKAFDKAPHASVIKAAANHSINNTALVWLISFLPDRTLCVRVSNHYSGNAKVMSGVVQGSTLGPILYDTFIDSL